MWLLSIRVIWISFFIPMFPSEKVRLKDIADIKGVQENHLYGFGLVIGLAGTGDKNFLTTSQAAANMLSRIGMPIEGKQVSTGSIAAVIVDAYLPPFSKVGQKINVKISVLGDAKSLAGGSLLPTPLQAANQQVYVIAQGRLFVGKTASVFTTANIPDGGMIHKSFAPKNLLKSPLQLNLRRPDFTTNSRVAYAINQHFKAFIADSQDPSSLLIDIPSYYRNNIIEFISKLENLTVKVDPKAVLVINSKTGTVVGQQVLLSPVNIHHAGFFIRVQPPKKEDNDDGVSSESPSVGELIEIIKQLGGTSDDLMNILQTIYESGAIQAELKIL